MASRAGKATGAALHIPTWSSYLAEAALCVGDIDRAEKAVVNGIKTSERHGDAFALADLKRLAGCVLLGQGCHDRARRAFEASVDMAQQQHAGLYLLRAGRDLARLIADRGDVAGAWEILSPIAEMVPEHRTGLDYQEVSELLSTLPSVRAEADPDQSTDARVSLGLAKPFDFASDQRIGGEIDDTIVVQRRIRPVLEKRRGAKI